MNIHQQTMFAVHIIYVARRSFEAKAVQKQPFVSSPMVWTELAGRLYWADLLDPGGRQGVSAHLFGLDGHLCGLASQLNGLGPNEAAACCLAPRQALRRIFRTLPLIRCSNNIFYSCFSFLLLCEQIRLIQFHEVRSGP